MNITSAYREEPTLNDEGPRQSQGLMGLFLCYTSVNGYFLMQAYIIASIKVILNVYEAE